MRGGLKSLLVPASLGRVLGGENLVSCFSVRPII